MSNEATEPTLRCPHCGHGLYTVDDVAPLTGLSRRTVQRRLDAAGFPGAIRERVPGGFRWLVPLEAVEGRVADTLPPLLETLIPELQAAREAEERHVDAQRRRSAREVETAARDADDALLRAFQRSREASEWFTELEGWAVDAETGPLLDSLQRAGIDFRRSLRAQSPEERLRALDQLLRDLDNAIRQCRDYQPEDSSR
jgi:hypothetical protein